MCLKDKSKLDVLTSEDVLFMKIISEELHVILLFQWKIGHSRCYGELNIYIQSASRKYFVVVCKKPQLVDSNVYSIILLVSYFHEMSISTIEWKKKHNTNIQVV